MDLKSIALDWLPTLPAKVALLLSLILSTTPFLLPEYVLSEIQLTPKAQLWLLKVAISLLLLLIGSCVVSGLVIYYYKIGKGAEDLAERLLRARARENRERLKV